jgi:hypothetical protein
MECPVCSRLADKHDRMERVWAVALEHINAIRRECDPWQGVTAEALFDAEAAWRELAEHKRTHTVGELNRSSVVPLHCTAGNIFLYAQ